MQGSRQARRKPPQHMQGAPHRQLLAFVILFLDAWILTDLQVQKSISGILVDLQIQEWAKVGLQLRVCETELVKLW